MARKKKEVKPAVVAPQPTDSECGRDSDECSEDKE